MNGSGVETTPRVGAPGALVCRECNVPVVVGTHVRDPQITLLAGHLRIAHPGALHDEIAPNAGAILAHFAHAAS